MIARRVANRKPPMWGDWQNQPANFQQVETALMLDHLLTCIIPGKSDLMVLDVDVGKGRPVSELAEMVEDSLGPAFYSETTPSGGRHLFYRTGQPVRNSVWEGGELICGSGYVAIYAPEALLAAMENVQDAQLVDNTAWPLRQQQAASGRQQRRSRRASLPSAGLEGSLRTALGYIPCCELGYHDWFRILAGLHHTQACGVISNGLELAVEFSRTDPDRFKPGEVEYIFSKLRASPPGKRPITKASIFGIAKRYGHQQSKYRRHKRKNDKLKKPERQRQLVEMAWASAEFVEGVGWVYSGDQGDVGHHFDVTRQTINRDYGELQDERYVRRGPDRIVTTEKGAHAQATWMLGLRDNEGWRAHIAEQKQPAAESRRVRIGGRVYRMLAADRSGGIVELVPVEGRAPP